MKNLFWLVPVGLVIWILAKRSAPSGAASQTARGNTAGTTTGTASTPDSFWHGWNTKTDQILQQTTQAVKVADQARDVIGQFVGFFGKPTEAQGPASEPTSNGSGAGVPDGEDWMIWN